MPTAGDESAARPPGRHSEHLFTEIVNALTAAIVVADIDVLTVEYASASLKETLGRGAEEVMGTALLALFPDGESAETFEGALTAALQEGRACFRSEQVLLRGEGDLMWTEITAQLIPPTEPDKVVCVIRDITERKLWEEALVQSHARLELLNSILGDVKAGVTVEAVVEATLQRLGDHFGGVRASYCEVDDENQARVTHSWSPDSMPRAAGMVADLGQTPDYLALLRSGQTVAVSNVDEGVNGLGSPVAVGATAFLHVPVHSGEGRLGLLCLDAPSKRVWNQHAENTLKEVASHLSFVLADAEAAETRGQLEEQLRQSQRIEAIGQLAGGVAHDFNNILTGIGGYVDLVLDRTEDGQARRDLEQVRRFTERAASLTHQLLAFSRRQPLHVEVVDINGLVGATTSMIERLIGEDIELTFEPSGDVVTVRADRGQIEQVLMNLAVNARDAMPEGGRLLVETEAVHLDEAYAAGHTGVTTGDYVRLSVSDTGVGIPPEAQPRIFEPFYTTKEQGKGTGLGLSTVYGIVKQHGGNVWVYSEVDRGTTFKIYLPSHASADNRKVPRAAAEPDRHGDETILLVEDESDVRDSVQRALEKYGYEVLSATHPEEARVVFRAHRDRIDLLLTDVVMPGQDGIRLHRSLQRGGPDLPVLFMSGYSDRAVLEEGVIGRGVPFIQKPFLPAQLARKVRAVLDERDESAS